MNQDELNQLMEESADNAVQTAKDEFSIELDFTAETLDGVDKSILGFLNKYPEDALQEKAIFTICNIYGAYLGETFKKQHKQASWVYDDSAPEAPSIFLAAFDKTFAFAGVCYEKLVKDSTVSVAEYFRQASTKSSH